MAVNFSYRAILNLTLDIRAAILKNYFNTDQAVYLPNSRANTLVAIDLIYHNTWGVSGSLCLLDLISQIVISYLTLLVILMRENSCK